DRRRARPRRRELRAARGLPVPGRRRGPGPLPRRAQPDARRHQAADAGADPRRRGRRAVAAQLGRLRHGRADRGAPADDRAGRGPPREPHRLPQQPGPARPAGPRRPGAGPRRGRLRPGSGARGGTRRPGRRPL
ncbi:MAG: Na(+) H(+) antiporter subunit G, partial [uncultured Friedmanniella sp.]